MCSCTITVSPTPPSSDPQLGRAVLLTLTHSAIGQLEALGTQALVGASCVPALTTNAAVLGVFALIHICGTMLQRKEGS